MVRVKVKVAHQLFSVDDPLKLGPVVNKGTELEVVNTIKRKVGKKQYDYFVVRYERSFYTAWPPHCEKV